MNGVWQMMVDKEIHKIKNELALIKVFLSIYDDLKSRRDGEKLIKRNVKQCINNIVNIERLLKRIERRDRQKEKNRNNR